MVVIESDLEIDRQTLESRIIAVTVYKKQALVTRTAKAELTGEESVLIINQLPVTLKPESVRVKGSGKIPVRLLTVNTEKNYSTESIIERQTQIERQIKHLEAQKRNLQAQVDALSLQSKFIEGLREKAEEQFSVSLARKNMSLSETLDLVNFLGSQYSEYAIATGEYKSQQKEIDKQIEALKLQLQSLQTPNSTSDFSLFIAIEPAGSGEFELEISYVVTGATWTPLYDLRVDSVSHSVYLSYLAEISQNSGEDWNNVALTLSTAKPGLGTLPPQLKPWYIDKPAVPVAVQQKRRSLSRSYSMNPDDYEESSEEIAFSLEMAEEETNNESEALIGAESLNGKVSKQGNVVTFKLKNKSNILSDGTPHKTTIFHDDYPCCFDYVTMPRLVSFAYLQANVKNSLNGATLLPGKANIFRDDVFVGTTKIANTVAGEEFKLNLGIDEGLKIERELVERQVDKKLIGNNRKITYTYKLVITNLLQHEANLKLFEQLPVSRNEQIKVRLSRTSPQINPSEMGILSWDLIIPFEGKQDIFYQFTVEHPPHFTVVGLDI
ncbi:mucoidy inhibitor MuiA family protein [Mastigocoleus testarum]|uniref:mucoidy inhibitor MuiA family protein n=1 Tax=Mastigocoleus testarum TaxID=996925 RepID=UPI000AD35CE9|nr:mucoidy inhibitor MuiA family protein [Mastigocoleus testarum]